MGTRHQRELHDRQTVDSAQCAAVLGPPPAGVQSAVVLGAAARPAPAQAAAPLGVLQVVESSARTERRTTGHPEPQFPLTPP